VENKGTLRRYSAKALANSDYHEGKAKALYIQYCVQSIKDQNEVQKAIRVEKEDSKLYCLTV